MSVFTLSYCLFEIPSGALGDRIGPRRVLTRIVLWWSTFTALTGAVNRYSALLVTRFLFWGRRGGSVPNAGIVVARFGEPDSRSAFAALGLL
ncbi:MAG TPA: MFS transporter, partial [Candidatus Acidoferrum sp.]